MGISNNGGSSKASQEATVTVVTRAVWYRKVQGQSPNNPLNRTGLDQERAVSIPSAMSSRLGC
jgi:hypothetical protein